MSKKNVAAICYDFDGTLSPGNMQEYDFFPELGIKPLKFWKESEELAKKHNADKILTYMKLMLDKANSSGEVSITKNAFSDYGKRVSFFDGVEDWFKRINEYALGVDLKLEHYIISSGLREMIEGTKIRKNFKEVYACSFFYDQHDVARWPSVAVNYTTKTQFLFRINKGIKNLTDDESINKFVPESERTIPFSRMIYIGDGDTDVPCMKLVKEKGGYSIAVYDIAKPRTKQKKVKQQKTEQLLSDGRVNFIAPADYQDGNRLDSTVKRIIDDIVSKLRLASLIGTPPTRKKANT